MLVNGKIPARTACPFKTRCATAEGGKCHHTGESHPVDFSCATARGFEMVEEKPIYLWVKEPR